MARPRTLLTTTGSLLLLASLTACGGSTSTKDAATPAAPASPSAAASHPDAKGGYGAAAPAVTGTIDAVDQKGDGKSLVVKAVDLEGIAGGWIAIHKDLDGKPGPIAGLVQVTKGMHSDVTVPFTGVAATGAYWPMLHVDDHTTGSYEFPKVAGADLPVMSGSDIVMKKITVTVG